MNKGIKDTGGCPLNFLRLREHHASSLGWGSSSAITSFLSKRLDLANNLYRRDLFAHYGCVNAIEFSNEGHWLISGGDDRRVLLWNLEASMSRNLKPTPMKEEHGSNIFCLAFDSQNSKIFSAGNDEQVIVHDVKTRETVNVFMHEEAIYSVSVNPYVDSVFASAGEDGQILIFDIRAPSSVEPLLLARSYDAYHAVQFHPLEPMFIVTANSKEGVVLWDVRKPRTPIVKYGEKRSTESSMCARFNSNGSQIIALRRRMNPILFNTFSATPVCEFDADLYYNSCTMKSCCFAGARDEFVLSGSDDFNLYMWRIPDANSNTYFNPEAHMVLKGHRSIVNQVRFNVHNFTIASSGVEKIVKLWSPVAVPGSHGGLSFENAESYMTRKVYTHEDYIGLVLDSGQTVVSHDYSHGSTDEDPKMMAFFDSLVQREVEGWTTNSDLSDDDFDANSTAHQSSSSGSSSSDSGDSDNGWAPSHGLSSSRRRKTRFQTRRQATNSTASGDRRRPAQGSEWILKLIAKKRAQLKAAKKKHRNQKKREKNKRHFIRCFTSSRQYLYRPENNSATTSNRSNRAAPADLLRRRHAVAPYTMMSNCNIEESEDSDSEEEADASTNKGPNIFGSQMIISATTSQENDSLPSVSTVDRKRTRDLHFWSSDSSTSQDEGIADNCKERKTTKKRRSDSYASSSGINKGAISINSISKEFQSIYRLRTIESDPDPVNNDKDNDISRDNRNQSNNEDCDNENNIVPISGISMDEAGSVMFVPSQFDFVNRNTDQESSSHENSNKPTNNSLSNNNNHLESNDLNPIDSNGIIDHDRSNLDINFSSAVFNLKKKSSSGYSSQELSSQSERKSGTNSRGTLLGTCNKLSFCEDETLRLPISPETSESSFPCDEGTRVIPYGVNVNTPDSGISVGDKGIEDSSSEERKDKKPSFRKKKIPEFRMKSYRSRFGNDGEEDKE